MVDFDHDRDRARQAVGERSKVSGEAQSHWERRPRRGERAASRADARYLAVELRAQDDRKGDTRDRWRARARRTLVWLSREARMEQGERPLRGRSRLRH